MKIIGITGGSGAGKTTITRLFKLYGADVLDADVVARQIVEPNCPALLEIEKEWPSVVNNSALDRKALAKIVFNDDAKLHKLNAITHKYIIDEINKQIKKSEAEIFVIDAIALFESGLADLCDVTACVITEKETRCERIMKRDNLTRVEAEERINAQQEDRFYIDNSDYTIFGDGDENAIKEIIGRIIKGC